MDSRCYQGSRVLRVSYGPILDAIYIMRCRVEERRLKEWSTRIERRAKALTAKEWALEARESSLEAEKRR